MLAMKQDVHERTGPGEAWIGHSGVSVKVRGSSGPRTFVISSPVLDHHYEIPR